MKKTKLVDAPKELKCDPAKMLFWTGLKAGAVKVSLIKNAAVTHLAAYSGSSAGCFALMNYKDPPAYQGDVTNSMHFFIVIASDHRLQTMLELAVTREESVDILCSKFNKPPSGPWNGIWEEGLDVYSLLQVTTHYSGLYGG
jgi:hypothetical protein